MERPVARLTRPSPILAALGGTVGTLLMAAVLHLTPVWAAMAGPTVVDLPSLIGAVFAGSAAVAFWLGWALFFVLGAWILPQSLAFAWPVLPGRSDGILAAVGKGVLWSLGLWALTGLLLPVLGLVARVEGLANPGLFALGQGWDAAAALLAAFLAYGLATGALLAMSQGIGFLDSLGWPGYGVAGGSARAEKGQA